VDARPDDIGELGGSHRLDRGYLHRHSSDSFFMDDASAAVPSERLSQRTEFCKISQYNSGSPPDDFPVGSI
jgi:hypothetical protein